MARALAAGFVRGGSITGKQVLASDPHPAARDAFAAEVDGAKLLDNNVEVAQAADILVLAIKPQYAIEVLEGLQGNVADETLVISIVTGLSLDRIESYLGSGPRLVRVMPNTPCLIGQSASGYTLGPGANSEDGCLVRQLLESVGLAIELEESQLHAVTGLSGSGPAFVFVLIEALADGGVRMGLPRSVAQQLAAQTVRGAAGLLLETGEHPGVLKDRVASPAGTTIAGLQALEEGGMRAALMAAVEAATRRSIELGRS